MISRQEGTGRTIQSGNPVLPDKYCDGRIRTYFAQRWPVRHWKFVETGRFKPSAVLIPLFLEGGGLSTMFTARPSYLRRHPGQISFPGGARESSDISPGDTALREAREELGLPGSCLSVLGMLPPQVAFTSDFLIVPVVAWLDPPEAAYWVVPDPQEVDRLIRAPFGCFSSTPTFEWKREGALSYVYPVFPLKSGDRIWGVTARILLHLVKLLQKLELC